MIWSSFNWAIISDEPELEFSGSSRAELWRFRAEPSWGTLIFELKPSWNFFKPQLRIRLRPFIILNTSDEPEPDFSSSSRAELWRFRAEPSRAEPSWGTSISELKPSWNFFDLREFSMNFQRSFNEFSWTFRLFNEFSWNFWFFKEFSWNFQLFRFAIH